MKRIIAYLSVALLLVILAGCGATAKMIAAKSQGERTDVFIEMTDTGAKPEGYIELVVKANIKTHVEGYHSDESGKSLHGKPGYPFVLNIDGQAVVWKVDGQKDVHLAYDEQGNTSKDPEAGTGVSYILERKIRLREGAHKAYFVLPEEGYIVDADITLRSGEEAVLEFKPLYWHKHIPYHIPTFLKGVRKYEIYHNGVKI
ncbi:MAG: hypothetical protein HGA43_16810 [Nitrospirae bacterium]|nr:hypothetical protein [Nitrospirota bacterium]